MRTCVLRKVSQYLEEKILSDNIEETQPLHSTLSEEELEKIKRFEERLSSMLEHSAKNIPFGPLETLTVLAGLHKNTLNELVQRPEMITAFENDLRKIRTHAEYIINRFSLPQEAEKHLLALMVHPSFQNLLRIKSFEFASEESMEHLRSAGNHALLLFLYHSAFSGNYRWIEKLEFFDAWGKEALRQIKSSTLKVIPIYGILHRTITEVQDGSIVV